MNILRWLLSTQLKPSHKQNKNSGFTLIELLVAMLIAFLVITPLLSFMISVLNTDGQEQAKANSEQEIKAALDYITRDLQQAIYIYDATGIACLSGTVDASAANTCPNASTTGNQLPSGTDKVPVLVFWKRELLSQTITITGTQKDDTFVYSLVAYYLIKDTNTTWSNAARIARWEIKDGVPSTAATVAVGACDGFPTEKYLPCPDKGFKPFDLSQKGITLQAKMNSWARGGTYDQVPVVLVDFIDQTTIAQGAPAATCSTGFNQVPVAATTVKTGFYACINSVGADNRSAAEVYLRGNAQARLIQNDETKVRYAQNQSSYFPSANIKVQGSSFIFTK
ncbi:hormogonium polysaccharide secretion pseudopilin HpsC [Nostoc sp. 'Lobaria pulmonaria (5183) cyanobiont']|uniref:hormogonium polysaccharide secretion pseudopilin HpsC n=1 Tax=Nostoc sp. 'Lobaria pulmonaria (5183) cyanobiont' TaxID=1618022 RepID=UPI000CF32449|nr:hormogonium polysaccharide secretion pseudopilin HpsC [Nostoc sp. 'Lobaria pulmonaria (5183) cyanobiont']AVH70158.1 prepilin-type N-terminal cleavage/methylation domain-containing protein [Nostoc sp. 'Lobaria pulmonaria (5183) cyanobiont']